MADNTITLQFQPCQQAPPNGYRVTYRPLGSEVALRTWPVNFTSSPAIFTDTLDAPGTEYEGFIQGDCGDAGLGPRQAWQTATIESESASEPPATLRVVNALPFNTITGVWTIPSTGGPLDAREATVDGGYPIAGGAQVNGNIHPDHDGDSDLEVIVYFGSAVFADTRVHVTDSDAVTSCASGTFVAVIGVTGPFRLANAETWQVLASNTPC